MADKVHLDAAARCSRLERTVNAARPPIDRRIVHNTGIPDKEFAYEYALPVAEVPPEADPEWESWLSSYLHRDSDAMHELLHRRFRELGPELVRLGEIVAEYRPFSLIVYGGTPHIWARKSTTDFIYLPPESEAKQAAAVLVPYRLESHALLVEFLAKFGGMGQRYLGEAVEFAGARTRGRIELVSADYDLRGNPTYLTKAESAERRRRFAPWIDGFTLLFGDDGLQWHIGPNGTICLHECGEAKEYDTCESFSSFLARFVRSAERQGLFDGVRHGLPEPETPNR